MVKCIECDKPAVWTRHTQFAGNHPYCEEHAKKESDWNENDSYTHWSIANILEGEKITTDDSTHYELSTLEKQAEFAKKRNYEWDEWKAIDE